MPTCQTSRSTLNVPNAASTPNPQSPAQTAGPRGRGGKNHSPGNRLRLGINRLDADTRAKIVILYNEGVSTTNLAKRYGVTAEWLRKTLYPAMGLRPVIGNKKWEFTK